MIRPGPEKHGVWPNLSLDNALLILEERRRYVSPLLVRPIVAALLAKARKHLHHTKNRPSAIAAEGRYWEPARGSATFSLPPVFPKKTAFPSARTLGTRNHDTHRLQDQWIRRISSTVSPGAEHKAGCLDRISRTYRMTYRDSTFSTTFSTSGYFTSTSSTQYSSVLPAYG